MIAQLRGEVGFEQCEGLPIQIQYWRKVPSRMGYGNSSAAFRGNQVSTVSEMVEVPDCGDILRAENGLLTGDMR